MPNPSDAVASNIVPVDDLPVASKLVPQSDLPSTSGPTVAVGAGQRQFENDKKILADAAGVVPDDIKAATYSGLNALLLNAPTPVVAAYTAYKENRPFADTFKEQKEYEDALARQYPKASMAGTAAGLGAGMLVGTGEIGAATEAAGAAARAATASRLGEGLLSGAAGKAAELGTAGATAAGMSGAAGYLGSMDPNQALKDAALGFGLGAAGQAVLPSIANYFTKNPNVLDESGNLTKEASDAVSSAFKGKLSDDDINAFKDKIAANMARSGLTDAAAKQALLESQGITPTRSMVTGVKPPASVADIDQKATQEAQDLLSQKAQALAGQAPSSTDLGEALHQAERDAHLLAQTQYEKTFSNTGNFDAGIYKTVLPTVQKQLRQDKIPNLSQGDIYNQSQAAMDYLEKGIAAGNMPYPYEPNNMRNIEQVRQQLNSYWAQAKGKDRIAMNSIIDGYDNTIVNAVNNDMFSGNGRQLLDDMQQARDLWSAYKTKFYSPYGAGATNFNQAVKSLADQATGKIGEDLSSGAAATATATLNSGLANPKLGAAVYDRLQNAFGKGSDQMGLVNQQIRSNVLNTAGDLTKLPDSIDDFLTRNPDLANRVFTPDEMSQMRRLSQSIKVINQAPVPESKKSSMIMDAVKEVGSGLAGLITWNLHGGLVGGATYLGTRTLSGAATLANTWYDRYLERAGAPSLTRAPSALQVFDTAPNTAVPIKNVTALQSPQEEPFYGPPTSLPPMRQTRKTGGRVANKITTAVERAKKQVNGSTEQLLSADDNHVARALEIANQRIEG
jgi:hypothetical protein